MQITLCNDYIKSAYSDSLANLIVWAQYYESHPRLDYMKLNRTNGYWTIKVILK